MKILLSLVFVLGLVFVGCGGDDDPKTDGSLMVDGGDDAQVVKDGGDDATTQGKTATACDRTSACDEYKGSVEAIKAMDDSCNAGKNTIVEKCKDEGKITGCRVTSMDGLELTTWYYEGKKSEHDSDCQLIRGTVVEP